MLPPVVMLFNAVIQYSIYTKFITYLLWLYWIIKKNTKTSF